MTTPETRMRQAEVPATSASICELTRDESFDAQLAALQDHCLYSKPRAALFTVPQLMDNPLYEGFPERISGPGNHHTLSPHELELSKPGRRASLSRLSLDELNVGSKQVRRMQSWSLSSREFEGMWRTVQENVFKSSCRESVSALEDFKQFRQKLANLKQAKDDVSAPPPTPAVGTPVGFLRSANLESVSARSLNFSPSRPTSPLQRLSVITSRKGVGGLLNSQRDSPQRGSGQLAPSVHRFAVSMRAEGLFKLPNPASISPLTTDHYSSPRPQPTGNSMPDSCTTAVSRRRFFTTGRVAGAEPKKPVKPAHGSKGKDSCMGIRSPRTGRPLRRSTAEQGRSGVVAAISNEVEAFMNSCSPRSLAALNAVSPRTRRSSSQPQLRQQLVKKMEKIPVSSSSSRQENNMKDLKGRCIHIPRPMCYSAHIQE